MQNTTWSIGGTLETLVVRLWVWGNKGHDLTLDTGWSGAAVRKEGPRIRTLSGGHSHLRGEDRSPGLVNRSEKRVVWLEQSE